MHIGPNGPRKAGVGKLRQRAAGVSPVRADQGPGRCETVPALPFAQPDPRPAAVLGDEFDPGRLEGRADRGDGGGGHGPAVAFKVNHGRKAQPGILSKDGLSPIKKRTGGAALCLFHSNFFC